jgi:hypothetical protein
MWLKGTTPMVQQSEPSAKEPAAARIQRWLARYGPAEVAAIFGSYVGYFATLELGGGPLVAAWIAALTENVGFYAVMIGRQLRNAPTGGRWRALARLGAELGPAELLDSALLRPVAVAASVALLGPGWGVLVGKLIADAGFYALAILMHEYLRGRERVVSE